MNTLMHVKGYGSAETKGAVAEVTRLIDEAERLGERLEDDSLLLSALFGQWIVNFIRFDGDAAKEIAARFLAHVSKAESLPLVVGHRTMGSTLALIGDLIQARWHYDQALALYRPTEHRRFMTRFGQDLRVPCLGFRSMALWLLGYPDAALNDADCALTEARQIGHGATLMFTLNFPIIVNTYCGNYARANGLVDELVELADQKGAAFRQAEGVLRRGYIATLAGSSNEAVRMVSSGISLWRSAGSTIFAPEQETMLAFAYARSGQFDAAWRCVRDAIAVMERTNERWCEAEVYRVAGEITLLSPEQDVSKAEAYMKRALEISRSQQARSWQLRAATSMARLLCRQHEPKAAYEVLAPAYDWFKEGFGTRDLQDAKSLLSNLQ
ncbi:tetratricopeptide repeat protein [Bradyrhizobium sp. USDA 4486]